VLQPIINSTIQTVNAKIEPYNFEIRSTTDQSTKIEPYNFEIRSTTDQSTKIRTYAIVNKTSDSLTQLATRFNANEIAYIRRLLDAMFDTNNTPTREIMAIKQMDASQLARPKRNRQSQAASLAEAGDAQSQAADTGITISEADAVLDALVADNFLALSHAKYYSLASRALMELDSYLKETYNEPALDEDDEPTIRIRDCEGCKEITTFGIRCDNRECGVRWHDQCANQYYRGKTGDSRKCPKCRTVCTGGMYVGERADRVQSRRSEGGVRANRDREMDESEDE
jgi:hypothetical protein